MPLASRESIDRAPVLGPWEKVEGAHTGEDSPGREPTPAGRDTLLFSGQFAVIPCKGASRLYAPYGGTRLQGSLHAVHIQRASCADAFRGRFILVTFRAVLLARVNPLRSSSDTLGDIHQSSVTGYACAHFEGMLARSRMMPLSNFASLRKSHAENFASCLKKERERERESSIGNENRSHDNVKRGCAFYKHIQHSQTEATEKYRVPFHAEHIFPCVSCKMWTSRRRHVAHACFS